MKNMITVLCAQKNSNYHKIPGLDVWDAARDAYYFTGSNPVITHGPCAQWSRLKAFASDRPDEKELAYFCLTKVIRNGGIFEHPSGSSFFKAVGITSQSQGLYSVDQSWWGFPARKTTLLYFRGCKPLPFPLFEHIHTHIVGRHKGQSLPAMSKAQHSTTVIPFAQWMINSIRSGGL